MKPDFELYYGIYLALLKSISMKYNPEHDINTSEGAPKVTFNEMTLTMTLIDLLKKVQELETELDATKQLIYLLKGE